MSSDQLRGYYLLHSVLARGDEIIRIPDPGDGSYLGFYPLRHHAYEKVVLVLYRGGYYDVCLIAVYRVSYHGRIGAVVVENRDIEKVLGRLRLVNIALYEQQIMYLAQYLCCRIADSPSAHDYNIHRITETLKTPLSWRIPSRKLSQPRLRSV
ncbi:hypothetical protein SDC9_131938 [bioreactor metagenome]|uniref:Uncharacterized protein n=1 Tax=bioreactor metagenome TaxID=1076179 RepID=A0A645D8D1_9ZZZZ